MMFVGFLGCYGAIQESQCLLGTFFACLVILFACEVAAGIWGFMHKDKISKELITFYDSVYDKSITLTDTEQRQTSAAVLKVFHETLNCCGKGGVLSVATMWMSDTCPKKTSDIFEMIFSMVLCCGIRNSPVY
ncbi:CD81 protein [Labeo rohita]|uniref:CD81 protein n=1 Tax=Labeo rohita TaxID=84645 RepID=A0ABQ8MID2_LABRO|nr:CD81 protein [Labeo rohita]